MSVTGRITLAGLVAVLLVLGAVEISPWPSALLIRWAFDSSGEWTNARLAPLIPAGITAHPDEIYDPLDPDARLDVFYPGNPEAGQALLTIVWIHGGEIGRAHV